MASKPAVKAGLSSCLTMNAGHLKLWPKTKTYHDLVLGVCTRRTSNHMPRGKQFDSRRIVPDPHCRKRNALRFGVQRTIGAGAR